MAQQKAVEMPVTDPDDLVDELEPGTKLLKGQYTITRYLNSGGFGITYLAKDSLDRDVVIKECFPSAFSRRSKSMVAARSRAHTAELRSVIQLFVKEARSLSKIVHPNIVAVHQVFEDNGTAYMAIDYVDGLDLQQIIDGQGTMPSAAEIAVFTEKLLHAVGFIHAHDMLHRDISPDNVLISKDGEPVLIDFGAAREQASQANRAMSALRVVKDGYSPQEFYIAGSEQGPWSDLYALGATLYHLISGEAPVNGQARLAALAEDRPDPYSKLDGRFDGYPPGFLAAIDKALSTLPKQRIQSAGEWLAMFSNGSTLQAAVGRVIQSREPIAAAVHDLVQAERSISQAAVSAPVSAEAPFGEPPRFARQPTQPRPDTNGPTPPATTGSGIGKVQLIAGVAATLAVVGAALLMMRGDETASVSEPPRETEPAAVAAEVSAESGTAVAEAAPAEAALAEAAPAEAAPAETAATETAATETAAAETAAAVVLTEPATEASTEASSAPAPEVTAAAAPELAATPEPEAPVAESVPVPEAVESEPVPAASEIAAPAGVIWENQVSFAAWDIQLPFVEGIRIVADERVAVVQSVLPGVDLSLAGTWIAPGVRVLSVNGSDVQLSGSIATAVLNAMKVDPDGNARVVVEYSSQTEDKQSGLLTVPANRLVSLGNGVNLAIRTVDGEWRTVVTGVTVPAVTQLRQGDVLYRDKTTGIALDGPESLEAIMAALVEQGAGLTQFSVLRENRIADAAMQLATD